MKKTAAILTATAIVSATALASLPARAAPTPASELSTGNAEELCNKLDDQFQFVMKFKEGLPYAKDARALHDSGVEKCEGGQPAQGVSDLRDSLRKMYVMPDTL